MNDEYSRLSRAVASALAACDPLDLADPAISLADEYESEAREIARRVLGAPAGSIDFQTVVQEVFVQQFAVRLSSDALSAIERAVA